MTGTSHAPFGTPFARNRFLQILTGAYAVLWSYAAIDPVDRGTWALENGLVAAAVALLVATHHRFVFSRLSYGLIFVFLLLHAVGSHYTYSAVPAGAWVAETLGWSRNHYDRFVHLAFGLLLAYPAREIAMRIMHVHRAWSYIVPVLMIGTMSSCYEMIESWAARLVDPGVGIAFVGAQGDVWDGQKDMSLAFGGAIASMAITALVRRYTRHEPYVALA